jgi:hypothetical protein
MKPTPDGSEVSAAEGRRKYAAATANYNQYKGINKAKATKKYPSK